MITVITGNGKGKTTAALGQALRAVGDGKRVLMVQFIKGPWRSGEDESQKLLHPHFKIIKTGLGFFGILGDNLPVNEHIDAAKAGLALAQGEAKSGNWDVLVFDELNNAVTLGLIPIADALLCIKEVAKKRDVVITGRDAPEEFIKVADIVSEVKEIKHPFNEGIKGKKGVEW